MGPNYSWAGGARPQNRVEESITGAPRVQSGGRRKHGHLHAGTEASHPRDSRSCPRFPGRWCVHRPAHTRVHVCARTCTVHAPAHACAPGCHTGPLHALTGNTVLWPPAAPARTLGHPEHRLQEGRMDGRRLEPRGALLYVSRQQEPEQSNSPSAPRQTKTPGKARGFQRSKPGARIKTLGSIGRDEPRAEDEGQGMGGEAGRCTAGCLLLPYNHGPSCPGAGLSPWLCASLARPGGETVPLTTPQSGEGRRNFPAQVVQFPTGQR